MMKLLVLIMMIFVLISCSKFIEMTSDDSKYVVLPMGGKDSTKLKPLALKNGRYYLFSKAINQYGLYVMYSSQYVNLMTGDTLHWRCSIMKFHDERNLKTFFNGSGILKQMNAKDTVPLSPIGLGVDKGYCINSTDTEMFILSMQKNNILYELTAEGKWGLIPDSIIQKTLFHMKSMEQYKI